MHYYQFNIADYRKDTGHLSLLEHGIYRSLLDSYYLNESPLCEDDANLMRTHCVRTEEEQKAFKNIINDYFILTKKGYTHKKCSEQIKKYNEKSEKARLSAKSRWDAKAMRTHSEGNANHKPITNNHKPIKKTSRFKPPTLFEVGEYCHERNNLVNPQSFIDHYESNGWMRGKTKIKDWKACVRTWESKANEKAKGNIRHNQTPTDRSRIAADQLRRQEATYAQDSAPIQTNDRLIR
jgi:uncharacterized protein YdaU (DUF1376 family)